MVHGDYTVEKDVLCVVVGFMETTQLKKTGVDPGILVRGGLDFFFQWRRVWGRP